MGYLIIVILGLFVIVISGVYVWVLRLALLLTVLVLWLACWSCWLARIVCVCGL